MKQKDKLAINFLQGFMAIFIGILFSSNVHAYNFTQDYLRGYYWAKFPIQMTPYASNETDAQNLRAFVGSAVSSWESVVGKKIWSISNVERSTNYQGNFIRWSDNFGEETGYDPSSTLAITIRYNKGTYFERVVIILNGSNPYLRQNFSSYLQKTLLHEFGHTIGIDHSDDMSAIMYRSLSNIYSLNYDDIQAANEAIDSMVNKQATGYVSPYSTSEEKVAACGSVVDISGKGPGGGNGSFIISLLLGVVMALSAKAKKLFN